MADAGLATMIVRTVLSLGIVLAVIGVAYAYVRRRATAHTPGRRSSRRKAQVPAIEEIPLIDHYTFIAFTEGIVQPDTELGIFLMYLLAKLSCFLVPFKHHQMVGQQTHFSFIIRVAATE